MPAPFDSNHTYPSVDALTIVLACRNRESGVLLRTQLLASVDSTIRKHGCGQYSFAAEFRQKLALEVIVADLASVEGVMGFIENVKERYVSC